MTGEELNILSKIKVRPVEEQRDYLLEQNMLLAGKIVTLEKENAELKDDNKVMADNYSKMEQKFYDNITKAKGIINTFVDWKKGEGGYDLPKNFLYYAEQFINEVEK